MTTAAMFAADASIHRAGLIVAGGPGRGCSRTSRPITPPVMAAMATHSVTLRRPRNSNAPPMIVIGSSRTTTSCTDASWPVPSAADASANEMIIKPTAASHTFLCSRSRMSRSRNSAWTGSSRAALRFSTLPVAFTRLARKART